MKTHIQIFRYLFGRLNLEDVFTPNTIAKYTYIGRKSIEEDFGKNLKMKGRQIIIYGHSGSGKTTLTRRVLEARGIKYIISHCETQTTFSDLLLSAFDKLDRFYISQKEFSKGHSINSAMKAEYKGISVQLSEQNTISQSDVSKRIVPPQLTPQKLAQFLGEAGAVWVIEDFHKISDDEKIRLADVLKIFIDSANEYPSVKIICIGAVGSARELISFDSNLYPRISELHVPLLEESEIKQIINLGCACLNIKMTKSLIDKVVFYSNRLASLAHQMCYEICYKNTVARTRLFTKSITDDQFKSAIQGYIDTNSDTLKGIYESITKKQLVWYLLKTIVSIEKEAVSVGEIKSRINNRRLTFEDEAIMTQLKRLSEDSIGVLRYNSNSEKYSIATPFWGAFLKMQLAMETAERAKRKKNKRNKNLIIKSQNDIDADVYDILLRQIEQLKANESAKEI